MKVIISGVAHRKGIAKKTSKSFDFKQIEVLQPIKVVDQQNYACTGHGFEAVQMQCDDDISFEALKGQRFPLIAELDFRPEQRGNATTLIVTGFKDIKPLVA